MIDAPVTMPSNPSGAKGEKLSPSNAVLNATTMKNASTPSLTATMARLTLALSRVPRDSSRATPAMIATATRFTTPPSDGDFEMASGMVKPNALSRNSLRLAPQPTDTAATAPVYSRIRSQPMTQATISPIVA